MIKTSDRLKSYSLIQNVTLTFSASTSASSVSLIQYLANSISRKQRPSVELLSLRYLQITNPTTFQLESFTYIWMKFRRNSHLVPLQIFECSFLLVWRYNLFFWYCLQDQKSPSLINHFPYGISYSVQIQRNSGI